MMTDPKEIYSVIKKEVRFESSHASGPGGQNVNKKNTRVTGLWNFSVSKVINDEQKNIIAQDLRNKTLAGRVLMFSSQKHRSQVDNKKDVITLMAQATAKVLKVKLPRIPTKPTAAKKEKRLRVKKIRSQVKVLRKKRGE